jgi:TonB family protein
MDSVATKAGEPDFTRYMAELQRKIKRNWFPPRDAESRRITVQFKVALDGSMSGLRITKSSGIGIADQAALNAVQNAAPFASLPKNSPDAVDIEFTFDYNVFNGGTGARIRTW